MLTLSALKNNNESVAAMIIGMRSSLIVCLPSFGFIVCSLIYSAIYSAAQRLALAAGGRVWIRLGSRKSPKLEKCSKMRQNPTSRLHAVLGGTSKKCQVFWQVSDGIS
jgi:hypothetical protein